MRAKNQVHRFPKAVFCHNKINILRALSANVDFKDEFYQRRWSKPIFDYGEMYNDADVALAPLLNNKFNMITFQSGDLELRILNWRT